MKGHRPLVFLDDSLPMREQWGFWCMDCPEYHFGSTSELHPSRLAKKHVKATRPVLQEAS